MDIIYTRHAEQKFTEERYVQQLNITKQTVEETVLRPDLEDRSRGAKITAIREISERHSLIVIYAVEGDKAFIITFFPARKGRYERKIL